MAGEKYIFLAPIEKLGQINRLTKNIFWVGEFHPIQFNYIPRMEGMKFNKDIYAFSNGIELQRGKVTPSPIGVSIYIDIMGYSARMVRDKDAFVYFPFKSKNFIEGFKQWMKDWMIVVREV